MIHPNQIRIRTDGQRLYVLTGPSELHFVGTFEELVRLLDQHIEMLPTSCRIRTDADLQADQFTKDLIGIVRPDPTAAEQLA